MFRRKKITFEVLQVVSNNGTERYAIGIDLKTGELCVAHRRVDMIIKEDKATDVPWSLMGNPAGLYLLLGMRDYYLDYNEIGILPGALETAIRRLGGPAVYTEAEHQEMATKFPGYKRIEVKRGSFFHPEAIAGLRTVASVRALEAGYNWPRQVKPRHLSIVKVEGK